MGANTDISIPILSRMKRGNMKLDLSLDYYKIESVVGVGDDNEQCRFSISQSVKLHFVGFHEFAQFPYVKGG